MNIRNVSKLKFQWAALGVAILCASMAVHFWQDFSEMTGADSSWFPVRFMRIEGDIRNLETDRFVSAVSPAISGSGFFSVNLPAIVSAAKSLAWVDKVDAERLWPDTIVLRVEEHRPVARWGGEDLLNIRGERFRPQKTSQYSTLPLLEAPSGVERQMLTALGILNAGLAERGVSVSELHLNERRAWVAKLSNGAEIYFGRQDPVVAFGRFMELVPKLGDGKFNEMQRLDLRYPNGFSVIWKATPLSDVNSSQSTGI